MKQIFGLLIGCIFGDQVETQTSRHIFMKPWSLSYNMADDCAHLRDLC